MRSIVGGLLVVFLAENATPHCLDELSVHLELLLFPYLQYVTQISSDHNGHQNHDEHKAEPIDDLRPRAFPLEEKAPDEHHDDYAQNDPCVDKPGDELPPADDVVAPAPPVELHGHHGQDSHERYAQERRHEIHTPSPTRIQNG